MPHLVKIGITNNPFERLQTANKHDTYKAPSGFRPIELIRVKNSKKIETYLQKKYKDIRVKNMNGNWSEFFIMTVEKVHDIFKDIEGERIDIDQFTKYSEKEEQLKLMMFVSKAIENDVPCLYNPNAKRKGSQCYSRYEKYSKSTSLNQARELGSTNKDISQDFRRGLVTFSIEC
jgi:predicted GIY-YIG superfamily endonuclease